jgi:hypothetical protein
VGSLDLTGQHGDRIEVCEQHIRAGGMDDL